MTTHATPIRNRMMQIADAKAHTHGLQDVYSQVAAVARTRIGTTPEATRQAITLLDAIRDALRGDASAAQHGLIARSYNVMLQLGLVD